jgi:hypothetical protein
MEPHLITLDPLVAVDSLLLIGNIHLSVTREQVKCFSCVQAPCCENACFFPKSRKFVTMVTFTETRQGVTGFQNGSILINYK